MKKIIVILFLLTVFLIGFLPAKDTDFGWHYRCGNQFLSTGKLCLTNQFSYFLPNYHAYYPSFLYDIVLAFTYNHGGFLAVSILSGFVFALTAILFISIVRVDLSLKIIGFFLTLLLSFSILNLGLRSQIVTYLFSFILMWMLLQKRKIFFYAVPFLFIVWTNTHIGFFVGLIVLAFFTFEKKPIPLWQYISIAFISLAATAVNPFGINVYREIANHAFSPLNTMIAEWVPPTPIHQVLIIALSIVGLVLLLRKRPVSFFKVFVLFFFGVFALQARRNLPFFYFSATYVFLDEIQIKLENFSEIFLAGLFVFFMFTIIVFVPATLHYSTSWKEYCTNTITAPYPCDALKKVPQISGNVFSLYEWGGFLIWQKPDIKIFADGRMPAWKDANGSSPYQVYLAIIQTQPGWNELLRSLKTDYIFINNGTFLDLLLKKDASTYGWKELYRDKSAVVYQSIL